MLCSISIYFDNIVRLIFTEYDKYVICTYDMKINFLIVLYTLFSFDLKSRQ